MGRGAFTLSAMLHCGASKCCCGLNCCAPVAIDLIFFLNTNYAYSDLSLHTTFNITRLYFFWFKSLSSSSFLFDFDSEYFMKPNRAFTSTQGKM